MASRDPADELRAQADIDAIATALAPLAEAYVAACARAGAILGDWARQVGLALQASASAGGVREGPGDPTGDPPIGGPR